MTVGLAADIITYLDASWVAGTYGTEPAWYIYSKNMEHHTNQDCLVEELPASVEVADIGQNIYNIVQRCRLEFKCPSTADADKKLAGTKAYCKAKTVTSGLWTIDEFRYDEQQGFTILEVFVVQETET